MLALNISTPSLISSIGTVSSNGELPIAKPSHSTPPLSSAKGKAAVSKPILYAPSHVSNDYAQGSGYEYTTKFDRVWNNPKIFKCLLHQMNWSDFTAVSRTSRRICHIFEQSWEHKNITLSRFIPGYKASRGSGAEVCVNLQDLEALMVSSRCPLHHYPRHAVNVLCASEEMMPYLTTMSDRFVRFAQAHSRFVLLLRCQASRCQPSTQAGEFIPKHNSILSLRELTFPAPLFTGSNNAEQLVSLPLSMSSSTTSKRTVSYQHCTSIGGSSSLPPSPRASKKQFSVFGLREKIPLPIPQPSPPSMKYYSIIGRKRLSTAESSHTSHSRVPSGSLPPPPRYPFVSSDMGSPSSSQGSLPRSTPSPSSHMQPSAPSAHDLIHAYSHIRAPILRVFVPCSSLDDDAVIADAEQQLISVGLWEHLRTGDAVINLGYVPQDNNLVCGWLIYSNDALHPFFPPNLPPIDNFEALESPLYFSHLIPPQMNLRCAFPLPKVSMRTELRKLLSNISSPHSPSGQARVMRYACLGQSYVREDDTEALGFGKSWSGEWILEADGTKEGAETLMDAIEHSEKVREWEIVLDRSGPKRLWLKSIPKPRGDRLSVENGMKAAGIMP